MNFSLWGYCIPEKKTGAVAFFYILPKNSNKDGIKTDLSSIITLWKYTLYKTEISSRGGIQVAVQKKIGTADSI